MFLIIYIYVYINIISKLCTMYFCDRVCTWSYIIHAGEPTTISVRFKFNFNRTAHTNIHTHTNTQTHRFNNPLLLSAALVPRWLEVCQVSWQHEGLGKETKLLLTKLSQQLGQVTPQTVLASELERPRKMVELNDIDKIYQWVIFT